MAGYKILDYNSFFFRILKAFLLYLLDSNVTVEKFEAFHPPFYMTYFLSGNFRKLFLASGCEGSYKYRSIHTGVLRHQNLILLKFMSFDFKELSQIIFLIFLLALTFSFFRELKFRWWNSNYLLLVWLYLLLHCSVYFWFFRCCSHISNFNLLLYMVRTFLFAS